MAPPACGPLAIVQGMAAELVVPDVIEMLRAYQGRLWWLHVPDSRVGFGSAGFPDFVIVGQAGIIFRECKPHASSQLSPPQTAWRYALLGTGADYAVWTRADLEDGTIRRQLEQLLSAG